MNKKTATILIVILSLCIGYLSGVVSYGRRYDRVAAEMDVKSHTLWELEKKSNIMLLIKEGKYGKADELKEELGAKQYHFNKEFDKRIKKEKWAARGVGAAVALFIMLLGFGLKKLLA